MARYRYRARLRVILPIRLAALIRKGREDCGEHEWYRSEEAVWRCYHCVAFTREVPWDEAEIEARGQEGAFIEHLRKP